ncbi:MAG TPA: carbon-nitrogen hydrolase family protein [Acidimicrobiales bacterium]|nr:carbon-nitrogen hydrolase family protein [Acidimicrobiales bacterium]
MRAWLVVHSVHASVSATLDAMLGWIADAATAGAEMVMFSEAALTGLMATGDPARDRDLAEAVPGTTTKMLSAAAGRWRIYVGFGLYERAGSALFDSAVVLGPDGSIALHYRRIDSRWHDRHVDRAAYRERTEVPVATTAFGRVAVVICGDLFNDHVCALLAELNLDVVVLPMARGFDEDAPDEVAWATSEVEAYAERAAHLGLAVLLVKTPGAGSPRRPFRRWGDGVLPERRADRAPANPN